jgi:glycerophosphoryl diester phosphodiesterase
MKDSEKLVIAHRGASAYERGNTFEAFEKAIEMHADIIELDLRKTKDGIYVAFHNPYFLNSEKKFINKMTYEELNEHTKKKGFSVPKVEEVLKKYKNKINFDIHLKEKDYDPNAIELIIKILKENQFIITCDYIEVLSEIRKKYPKIKLGHILQRSLSLTYFSRFIISKLYPYSLIVEEIKENFDFIVPDYKLAGKRFIKECEKRNMHVIPWAIDKPDIMKRFSDYNIVYGIITNKPDLGIEVCKKK